MTNREKVRDLSGRGYSSPAIARLTGIPARTVRHYLRLDRREREAAPGRIAAFAAQVRAAEERAP